AAAARGGGRGPVAGRACAQRRLAPAVGRHQPRGAERAPGVVRRRRATHAPAGQGRAGAALRGRGGRPVRGPGHRQQRGAGVGAVGLGRLLAGPGGRRSRPHAAGGRHGDRPLLHRGRAAPGGGLRPPGEHQLAARGREARAARGGVRPALPAHRRRLARPPDLRGDRRRGGRVDGGPAGVATPVTRV
ncbi:MAG: Ribosomal-protein-S5p-alanine acetyltransferase, partial [uncultured Nocardioides sp.]